MASKKGRQGFLIYHDDIKGGLRYLSDEQLGRLVRALATLSMTMQDPEDIDPDIAVAYGFTSTKLIEGAEKYDSTCESRAAAGRNSHASDNKVDVLLTNDTIDDQTRDDEFHHRTDTRPSSGSRYRPPTIGIVEQIERRQHEKNN